MVAFSPDAVSRNLFNSLSSHFRPLPGPHWPGVKPAFWGGEGAGFPPPPGTRRSSRGAPGGWGGTMPGLPRPRWATGGTWRGSRGAGGGRQARGVALRREVRRGLAGPPGARPGERSAASPLSVLPEAAGYCLTSPPTSPFAQGIDRLVGAGPLSGRHPANLISSRHMVHRLRGSRGPHTHTNNRRGPTPAPTPPPRPRPRPTSPTRKSAAPTRLRGGRGTCGRRCGAAAQLTATPLLRAGECDPAPRLSPRPAPPANPRAPQASGGGGGARQVGNIPRGLPQPAEREGERAAAEAAGGAGSLGHAPAASPAGT